jgi:L-fucose isomerase-like protein
MLNKTIVLGVTPVKRAFLSLDVAKAEKAKFMGVIQGIYPGVVKIVDVDDVVPDGIVYTADAAAKAIGKLKAAGINALFIPFCDFGEEGPAAAVAEAFKGLPILIWGPRDEKPNREDQGYRGRDTQCGIFAATKVMSRKGVKYSYIYNVATESAEFKAGYTSFLRTAAIVKDLRGARIAQIGARPVGFESVIANEGDLVNKFGITIVPISPSSISDMANRLVAPPDPNAPPNPFEPPFVKQMVEDGRKEVDTYFDEMKKRHSSIEFVAFGPPGTPGPDVDKSLKRVAALKVAMKILMDVNNCSGAAFECWSAMTAWGGATPCISLGDLATDGYPMACETDVYGALSRVILRAAHLYGEATFLADLTIRNPQNENSELLWHCGPFPYSLKNAKSPAGLRNAQGQFYLKDGDLTLCKLGFDENTGKYWLFGGEGKTTTGPESSGTYVWLEVDNWKRWEEKLVFGPYIHHVGGAYGHYLGSLREAARYLDMVFDNAHEQGIHSL